MNRNLVRGSIAGLCLVLSACQLKSSVLGGGSSMPSAPSAPDPSVAPVASRGAPATAATATDVPAASGPAVGAFEEGGIIYRDGRLHLIAWAVAPTAPVVKLRRGSQVLGEVKLVQDQYGPDVFRCDGVAVTRSDGEIRLDPACSIAGTLEATSYELELVAGSTSVAKLAFQLVSSVDMAGTKSLIVRPKDRHARVFLRSGGALYWQHVDIRDQVQSLQFVWLNGDKLDAAEGSLARQKKIYWDTTPVTDVAVVNGGKPSVSWANGAPALRLLVFRDGSELLGSYRIGAVLYALGEFGKLATMVPATDVTPAQVATARTAAADRQASAERSGADGFGVEWTEDLTCAVFHHKEAREALKDAVSGAKGSAMAREEARQLDRDADRRVMTAEDRRKMKQSAANTREGAGRVAARGSEAEKRLDKFVRKYQRGCLAKIAPVD